MSRSSRIDVLAQLFISSSVIIFLSVGVNYYVSYHEGEDFKNVEKWLIDVQMETFTTIFQDNGERCLMNL